MIFNGYAHPAQFRRLLYLLVSLGVLGSMLLINVPAARAGNVGGPINTNTTWTLAGSPYVVTSPVLVMEGVTLTIQPGVVVKFNSHKALQIDGELIAVGTSQNPITFTSNLVPAAPGDWDYIVFTGTSVDAFYDIGTGIYQSGSTLQYVIIEYAGGASVENNGALRLDAAAPYITHAVIRNNASNGIIGFNYLGTLTLKTTHNTITNNAGTGISVREAAYAEITDNTIVGNVNSPSSWGGGIRVDHATTSLISRNVIRGNTHAWFGSGIDLGGGSSTISDNVITENSIADCNPCWENSVLRVSGGEVTIRNNLVAYNFTGGIFGGGDSPVIVENIFIHNQGIAFNIEVNGTATISHNIISDNTTGLDVGAFRLRQANANISYNSILRNTALDNAAFVYEGPDEGSAISANTIVGNVNQSAPGNLRAVSIQGHPTFNDNNIYNNTGYALSNLSPQGTANLNAENNWWGTSNSPAIQALIHDWFDDSTVGIVNYSPYRSAHNLDAPVSPPTGLNVTLGLTSIGLSWAANPESDVTGYKVYYDTDGKYPYTGTEAAQGASPIEVGNAHSLTLTGLPVGKYYLSVTAYDAGADGAHDQTDGNESWFAVDAIGMIGEAPQAEFSAVPTSGVAPLLVNFSNESTGLHDTCAWDFGDGSTSSSCANPTHTYTTTGVFTVTLTINGVLGPDTRTRASYISVYTPAQADFSATTPTSGLAPLEVNFTNQSTGDYTTCAWDFGDGGTSSNCSDPTYTYTTGGVYTVTLTVSGLGGTDTETEASYITVYAPVQADFTGLPTSGSAPMDVTFTNLSSGDYDTCAWDFGDGGTSDLCDPTYNYTTPGVYAVTLTVSGLGGTDTETKASYISVYTPVQADFTGLPTSGSAPLDVNFTNQSTGDYDTCAWDFGDGVSSSNCSNPTHTYTGGGAYTVTLTVNGPGGNDVLIRPDYITVNYVLYLPLILRQHP